MFLIPHSLFLIPLNYLDSNVIPFTFRVKDGERHPQLHSGEYYWLGPDLTRNTRRRCILIFPAFLITLNRIVLMTGPKSVSHYTPLAQRLLKSGYVPHI